MSEGVLIAGASSAIGRALARRLAAGGCRLVLAGRRGDDLERTAADLRVRHGASVHVAVFDALDLAGHESLVRGAEEAFGGALDGVIVCFGYLPGDDEDPSEVARAIDVNFTAAASLLAAAASILERRRRGWIAAITSIAADRARPGNYAYGAAKAGLSAFVSGLRDRLRPAGVHVLEVKPGFVDTKMIDGKLAFGAFLAASPERVARDVDDAIRRRRALVYTPWFWREVMAAARAVPDRLFVRLRR